MYTKQKNLIFKKERKVLPDHCQIDVPNLPRASSLVLTMPRRLRRFCYVRYLNRELCYPLHHLHLDMPSCFTAYHHFAHYDRHRIYMPDILKHNLPSGPQPPSFVQLPPSSWQPPPSLPHQLQELVESHIVFVSLLKPSSSLLILTSYPSTSYSDRAVLSRRFGQLDYGILSLTMPTYNEKACTATCVRQVRQQARQ